MATRSEIGEHLETRPAAPAGRRAGNIGGAERLLSLAGGAALATYGLGRRDAAGLGLAALGGVLAGRALTGRSRVYGALGISTTGGRLHADHASVDAEEAVSIRHSTTIARPREEVYRAWREFERLPRFIEHLERVELLSPTRSRWAVRGPGGVRVEWDAALVEEREGERIVWETVEPTDVPHRGEVTFRDAPGRRGTEVRISLEYEHPAGALGRRASRALPAGRLVRPVRALFHRTPDEQVRNALRQFKQILEAGEVPTTEGQPSGREKAKGVAQRAAPSGGHAPAREQGARPARAAVPSDGPPSGLEGGPPAGGAAPPGGAPSPHEERRLP